MRRLHLKLLLIALVTLSSTGCWNKLELPERSFIMSLGIDEGRNGNIRLTAQLYKPNPGLKERGGDESFFNVQSEDESMFETVRDLTLHMGRKVHWSHLRIIVIGEEFAKKRGLEEVLDFFYRNQELRLTSYVHIAKGKAGKYMSTKPLIENTLGQQLLTIQEVAYKYSGKTANVTLLDLGFQLKGQVDDAMIPYLYRSKKITYTTPVAGAALLKKGKMIGKLSSKDMESVLMLRDEYKRGVFEIPCLNQGNGKSKRYETVQIISSSTQLSPEIKQRSVTVKASITIEGTITELKCSKITTSEEEIQFINQIKEFVEQEMLKSFEELKKKKADVINLGNLIYRRHPALWKSMKEDWHEIFANSQLQIHTDVKIINTGTTVGKSVLSKEK
ncbi:Ger(x)C family spore germination protein [Paenibacillus alkaliterrae]|uniref:Ger(x)C family spore germination protein n=1 Tax=Paenibacillus alkaliterrae TaxID=320909 RepID=UPI001F34DB26|nr:Ger(x)C family spore germination protein [Paenibacillus alkaliterrae]MCF2938644.1 Ger(x)C family spore germination protein [Paenibacillus alkaliterrae]